MGWIKILAERSASVTCPKTFNALNISATNNIVNSIAEGLVASTTQAQGEGPLTKEFNIVSSVANANDVVTLPDSSAGITCYIKNIGANTLQVFPASGDRINSLALDASVTISAGASTTFRAVNSTNWYT